VDLSVGEDANDGAVFLDALKFAVDGLTGVLSMLFGIPSERLLL